jgi:hypothetical protein
MSLITTVKCFIILAPELAKAGAPDFLFGTTT